MNKEKKGKILMLDSLGKIIEKKPWLVVAIVVMITVGFACFIPGLEFKTDFADFAPDNDLVKANNRISEYFGMNNPIMFFILDKQQTDSTLSPQALRDQYAIIQELDRIPEINSTVSIITFVDAVCLMEFNKTINECSDEQIESAVRDLFEDTALGEYQLFNAGMVQTNQQSTRFQKLSSPSTEIKNCYLEKNNNSLSFSFAVSSLDDVSASLKPVIPRTNLMEWYVSFENSLLPSDYQMQYQIAARIEPSNSLWHIGKGVFGNIRSFFQVIKNRAIREYTAQAYLWLTPPRQSLSFPIHLETGSVRFDTSRNRIIVEVNQSELCNYGIAMHFGSFELPAKLTNFSAGVRYYQTPFLHRPAGRVVINTSFLFDRIQRLQNKPIRGALVSRLLEKNGISLDDFSDVSMMGGSGILPETISLKDVQLYWTSASELSGDTPSSVVFPLLPSFFKDLRVNALSFISKDYSSSKKPSASIIIAQLDVIASDSEELARVNSLILDTVTELDTQFSSISIQATSEGIISTEINDVAMSANTVIAPSIFILIICILFLAFKKPSYVVLPILVFAFSCIWLFGTMSLLGISFSIIAVALLPLNIGLGVEYSVNILHNYRIELSRGRSPAEAIRLSIKEVGIAIFLAWFTTFVAFLSFLTASLPPIRDFGIFLALGITYTFIITLTFLPSVRYLVDRRKKPIVVNNKKPLFSMKDGLGNLACFLLRHDKIVFVCALLICAVMGAAVTQVKTGFSMDQFMPKDNPSLKLFEKMSSDFPFSSQDQEYILLEGNLASTDALSGISKTHQNMKNDQFVARKADGSPKTESIFTIITQALTSNQSLIQAYNIDPSTGIPKTDADVVRLYDYLYDSDDYGIMVQGVLFRGKNRYTASIIRVYISLETDSEDMTKDFEILKDELNHDIADFKDIQTIATGNMLITLTIMKNMTESQIISTVVCFLLAAIMISLIYKNPLLGLIVLVPVSCSIIWVLGTMFFIGFQLNIMTIMVTCLTIGIGIDYGCYITERFKLVADKTGDITKAVVETISHTGNAIFIAALSSVFGFGVLMFAPIPPQQQFGLITAITLIYAYITSIFILPLVLARWARWRKKKLGYIISPGAPRGLEGINDDVEYSGEQ